MIPGFRTTLFALSDVTDVLKCPEIWLIHEGRALVGECTVWRTPCQQPWDVANFKAVRPPPSAVLPRNAVIFAADGMDITMMAGGDYDGDMVMISFNPQLISLVTATSDPTGSFDVAAAMAQVDELLQKAKVTTTAFIHNV